MRIATLILAFVVGVPALGAAQDWAEYTSIQDGFRVDFPGTPTITNTTWQSQLDYVLPGRIYTVQKGKERYSMTVIDYHPLEQEGIDRAAKCPEGNAQCRQNAGIMGPDYPLTYNAVSGYSGGGRKMIEDYEAKGPRAIPYLPYGLTLAHKHLPIAGSASKSTNQRSIIRSHNSPSRAVALPSRNSTRN